MKNQLDLYNAAHVAAAASLNLPNDLAVSQAKDAGFITSGADPANYDSYVAFFNDRRNVMKSLAGRALATPSVPPPAATLPAAP
jgi:hypothetical protein